MFALSLRNNTNGNIRTFQKQNVPLTNGEPDMLGIELM
jgi:hypothetical protein